MTLAREEKKYKRKKKIGSYQYGSVIFSITLALFVIGLFGLLLIHSHKLTRSFQENIELQVYLNSNISDNQKDRIQNELANMPYVLKKNNEASISFISKEEAATQFIEETGEDFRGFLGENPLKDALIVNIEPSYQESQQLDSIKSSIEQMNGVFEVAYVRNLVDSINKNVANISLILLGFAAILLLVVTMLINSTIRLALFSQRFLIRSMQLVGATKKFIKRPFLNRAMLHGMISGIIASALLFGLLNFAYDKIESLAALRVKVYIFALYGLLIFLGGVIAFFSTHKAMNRYLKMSLDDLY